MQNNPFQKATTVKQSRKIMLFGKWGVGKTRLALQFPGVVMLDLDRGSTWFGRHYYFDVKQPKTVIETKNAIAWLINNDHEYKTLVIDPITCYWDMLQKYWSDAFLKRQQGSKTNRHDYYDLGPKEWGTIKSDYKALIDRLLDLDMNVILISRETAAYKPGAFMVYDGIRADCEKNTPYALDVVLRLYKTNTKFMATVEKDRTESLPLEPFEMDYELILSKLFPKE